jgi:hypothetical protein
MFSSAVPAISSFPGKNKIRKQIEKASKRRRIEREKHALVGRFSSDLPVEFRAIRCGLSTAVPGVHLIYDYFLILAEHARSTHLIECRVNASQSSGFNTGSLPMPLELVHCESYIVGFHAAFRNFPDGAIYESNGLVVEKKAKSLCSVEANDRKANIINCGPGKDALSQPIGISSTRSRKPNHHYDFLAY